MIYLPERNLTIVTPYKCGSSSLHDMLCTERHGGQYVLGPQPGGEIDKHTFARPWFARNGKMVVVCRNPYDRVGSLHNQFLKFMPPISFDDWLDQHLWDEIHEPVSASLDRSGLDMIDYWQLEHIQECLAGVGITELVPHKNPGRPVELTDEQVEKIRPWAKLDCDRFGYAMR